MEWQNSLDLKFVNSSLVSESDPSSYQQDEGAGTEDDTKGPEVNHSNLLSSQQSDLGAGTGEDRQWPPVMMVRVGLPFVLPYEGFPREWPAAPLLMACPNPHPGPTFAGDCAPSGDNVATMQKSGKRPQPDAQNTQQVFSADGVVNWLSNGPALKARRMNMENLFDAILKSRLKMRSHLGNENEREQLHMVLKQLGDVWQASQHPEGCWVVKNCSRYAAKRTS